MRKNSKLSKKTRKELVLKKNSLKSKALAKDFDLLEISLFACKLLDKELSLKNSKHLKKILKLPARSLLFDEFLNGELFDPILEKSKAAGLQIETNLEKIEKASLKENKLLF